MSTTTVEAEVRELPRTEMGVPRYTPEETTRALTVVALAGSYEEAERLLKEDDNSPNVSAETLGRWCRTTKAAEYERLRTEIMPRIQARAALASEDVVIRATAKEKDLLDVLDPKALEPKDVAVALRSVSVTAGIATDRTLKLRGQPTQIIEHRDASEILKKLKGRAGVDVDSTAEPMSDAELVTDTAEQGVSTSVSGD